MKVPSRFINKSKGEAAFKDLAGIDRFEKGLWEHVEQLCFEYFAALAKAAGERVQAEERTVLDVADVQPPEGTARAEATPEELFEQLYSLPASEIAKFGSIVEKWVDRRKSESQ